MQHVVSAGGELIERAKRSQLARKLIDWAKGQSKSGVRVGFPGAGGVRRWLDEAREDEIIDFLARLGDR